MVYINGNTLFFSVFSFFRNRCKRTYIVFVLLFGLNAGYSQCLSTFTDFGPYNPVCSFQRLSYPAGGQIRINLSPLTSSNTYRFTTVGESTEDTFLALYDSAGVLLASNDDAGDCLGCRQSTIVFDSPGLYIGAYVILSKSGCLNLSTAQMRFNVTNNYDPPPDIIEPEVPFYPCKGKTADLEASAFALPPNPWSSSDPSIAAVDPVTGVVSFLKEGIVKIKLLGNLTCETIKTYNVTATQTSAITHD